ncbi:MAG: GTPase ObgE [Weeksellaceae bacterium]
MLVDEINITVIGGKGGEGVVRFFPKKAGPAGGNGGNGGNVYAYGNQNLSDLKRYAGAPRHEADAGQPGETFERIGHKGEDLLLHFPIGTLITDTNTGEQIEITHAKQKELLVTGGKGGRGNSAFKSATNQTPRQYEPGTPGQERHFHIIMRFIADFGFIGFPNAGKSSLLNELTAASVRTAAYPFTTLEPNLGEFEGKIIADIPGLIEGASSGKGLGHKFLKHIEKVPVLLHTVSLESKDILRDIEVINDELKNYREHMGEKPQTILLTKTDLVDETFVEEKVELIKSKGYDVIPVSIFNPEQFEKLQDFLRSFDK